VETVSSEVKDRLYRESLNGPRVLWKATSFGFDSTRLAWPEILEMKNGFQFVS
jgi:hypothetical protein